MISEHRTRIIAKISGDGHLGKRQIMYFNTCPVLINEFKTDIKKEFGEVRMSEGQMNSGTPYVAVYGKEIVKILTDILPCYKSSSIIIPKSIIQADENIIKTYIRTFYDDEGCSCLRLNRNTNEWKRNITLSSNSKPILLQIKKILETFGMKTNKIIKNHNSSKRDKSFLLSITGKENFIKFQKKINFKHPRKIKMLNLIIESYNATSKNKLKFLQLKKKLNKLTKK